MAPCFKNDRKVTAQLAAVDLTGCGRLADRPAFRTVIDADQYAVCLAIKSHVLSTRWIRLFVLHVIRSQPIKGCEHLEINRLLEIFTGVCVKIELRYPNRPAKYTVV